MAGISNLSDAMLVLALGFLIFAIMALSVNPQLIAETTSYKSTQDVSTGDVFNNTTSEVGGMEDSGYSQVGTVYKDPYTGDLVMVSG